VPWLQQIGPISDCSESAQPASRCAQYWKWISIVPRGPAHLHGSFLVPEQEDLRPYTVSVCRSGIWIDPAHIPHTDIQMN